MILLLLVNCMDFLVNRNKTMEWECGVLRDWSLITGRGGGYKTGGGAREVYPYEKGGRKKF